MFVFTIRNKYEYKKSYIKIGSENNNENRK